MKKLIDQESMTRLEDDAFEQIDEWVNPLPPNDNPFMILLSTVIPRCLGIIQRIAEDPHYHSIGSWSGLALHIHDDLLSMDISKEMRWLGFPESEIKRWAFVKKIERETGKRCDDYV